MTPPGQLVYTAAPGEANCVTLAAGWDEDASSPNPGLDQHLSDDHPITRTTPPVARLHVGRRRLGRLPCQHGQASRLALGDADDSLPGQLRPRADGHGHGDRRRRQRQAHRRSVRGVRHRSTAATATTRSTARAVPTSILGGNGDDHRRRRQPRGRRPRTSSTAARATTSWTADYSSRFKSATTADASITLAGGADDGRPGEGDDIRGVEKLITHQGGALTGTDADEYLQAFQTNDKVSALRRRRQRRAALQRRRGQPRRRRGRRQDRRAASATTTSSAVPVVT